MDRFAGQIGVESSGTRADQELVRLATNVTTMRVASSLTILMGG